jgi:hypothetical protein
MDYIMYCVTRGRGFMKYLSNTDMFHPCMHGTTLAVYGMET